MPDHDRIIGGSPTPSAGGCEVYNWNELPRETVRDGVSRAGFKGEQVLLVMNWLQPGMVANPHSHPFEQIVYIVQGTVLFHLDAEVVTAGPGSIMRIPPGVVHYAEPVGSEPALNLDVFAPHREDYAHLTAYQDGGAAAIET
jgi:quercetin dioxygenase-like cupin family protein